MKIEGGNVMKFVKGMIIGGVITAGIAMMYKDEINMSKNKKRMIRKGRQMIKKIGII